MPAGARTLDGAAIFLPTSVLGRCLGNCWPSQFAEIWEKLGRPDDFTIVEQGAHDGVFAVDVLNALRESAGKCFAATSYVILEPFLIWRERQQKHLHEFGRKNFLAGID